MVIALLAPFLSKEGRSDNFEPIDDDEQGKTKVEIELSNPNSKESQDQPTGEIQIIKDMRGPGKVLLMKPNDAIRRHLHPLFIEVHIERVLVIEVLVDNEPHLIYSQHLS